MTSLLRKLSIFIKIGVIKRYGVWSVSKLSTESVGSRRELVANCVHTADDSTVSSRRRCVLGFTNWRSRRSPWTGDKCREGSCSRSPCRLKRFTVMIRSTFGSPRPSPFADSPTPRFNNHSGPPPILCLFPLLNSLLLDVAPSLLLVLVYIGPIGLCIWNDLPSDVTPSPSPFRTTCTLHLASIKNAFISYLLDLTF